VKPVRQKVGNAARHAGGLTWLALPGKPSRLRSGKGRRIYRFASCSLCNYRIHEVLARYEEFTNAGIRLVGVFQSPPEKIAKYVAKKDPPFNLIADPKLDLYRLYGVSPSVWALFKPDVFSTAFKAMCKGIFPGSIEGPVAMRPAEFLIDPEGLIWDSFYGRSVADHMPFERVAEFAADPCLSVPA
jgi:peroxiredoxin